MRPSPEEASPTVDQQPPTVDAVRVRTQPPPTPETTATTGPVLPRVVPPPPPAPPMHEFRQRIPAAATPTQEVIEYDLQRRMRDDGLRQLPDSTYLAVAYFADPAVTPPTEALDTVNAALRTLETDGWITRSDGDVYASLDAPTRRLPSDAYQPQAAKTDTVAPATPEIATDVDAIERQAARAVHVEQLRWTVTVPASEWIGQPWPAHADPVAVAEAVWAATEPLLPRADADERVHPVAVRWLLAFLDEWEVTRGKPPLDAEDLIAITGLPREEIIRQLAGVRSWAAVNPRDVLVERRNEVLNQTPDRPSQTGAVGSAAAVGGAGDGGDGDGGDGGVGGDGGSRVGDSRDGGGRGPADVIVTLYRRGSQESQGAVDPVEMRVPVQSASATVAAVWEQRNQLAQVGLPDAILDSIQNALDEGDADAVLNILGLASTHSMATALQGIRSADPELRARRLGRSVRAIVASHTEPVRVGAEPLRLEVQALRASEIESWGELERTLLTEFAQSGPPHNITVARQLIAALLDLYQGMHQRLTGRTTRESIAGDLGARIATLRAFTLRRDWPRASTQLEPLLPPSYGGQLAAAARTYRTGRKPGGAPFVVQRLLGNRVHIIEIQEQLEQLASGYDAQYPSLRAMQLQAHADRLAEVLRRIAPEAFEAVQLQTYPALGYARSIAGDLLNQLDENFVQPAGAGRMLTNLHTRLSARVADVRITDHADRPHQIAVPIVGPAPAAEALSIAVVLPALAQVAADRLGIVGPNIQQHLAELDRLREDPQFAELAQIYADQTAYEWARALPPEQSEAVMREIARTWGEAAEERLRRNQYMAAIKDANLDPYPLLAAMLRNPGQLQPRTDEPFQSWYVRVAESATGPAAAEALQVDLVIPSRARMQDQPAVERQFTLNLELVGSSRETAAAISSQLGLLEDTITHELERAHGEHPGDPVTGGSRILVYDDGQPMGIDEPLAQNLGDLLDGIRSIRGRLRSVEVWRYPPEIELPEPRVDLRDVLVATTGWLRSIPRYVVKDADGRAASPDLAEWLDAGLTTDDVRQYQVRCGLVSRGAAVDQPRRLRSLAFAVSFAETPEETSLGIADALRPLEEAVLEELRIAEGRARDGAVGGGEPMLRYDDGTPMEPDLPLITRYEDLLHQVRLLRNEATETGSWHDIGGTLGALRAVLDNMRASAVELTGVGFDVPDLREALAQHRARLSSTQPEHQGRHRAQYGGRGEQPAHAENAAVRTLFTDLGMPEQLEASDFAIVLAALLAAEREEIAARGVAARPVREGRVATALRRAAAAAFGQPYTEDLPVCQPQEATRFADAILATDGPEREIAALRHWTMSTLSGWQPPLPQTPTLSAAGRQRFGPQPGRLGNA